MAKETRVYLIEIDQLEDWLEMNELNFEEYYNAKHIPDEDFIAMAEERGLVYSIQGFVSQWNDQNEYSLSAHDSFIRILDVELS